MKSDDRELDKFLARMIATGVHDMDALIEIILDDNVSTDLFRVAQHNPMRGQPLKREEVIKEIELRVSQLKDDQRKGEVEPPKGEKNDTGKKD